MAVGFKNIPINETEERHININQIKEAGGKILEGVNLSYLGDDEINDLETDCKKKL
ncbi:MAG: hypothetical protein J7L96_05095 [Bacteroidales bacterium]|nr:hypothetical protein [Bacteroidales bacterium]